MFSLTLRWRLLSEVMACTRIVIHVIDLLQGFDALQGVLVKRTFALKGVQDNTLRQIT